VAKRQPSVKIALQGANTNLTATHSFPQSTNNQTFTTRKKRLLKTITFKDAYKITKKASIR
jgi:hypothetical protein